MKTFIKETYESYKTDGVPHTLALEYTISDVYERLVSEGLMNEDLRKWFGKGKTGGCSSLCFHCTPHHGTTRMRLPFFHKATIKTSSSSWSSAQRCSFILPDGCAFLSSREMKFVWKFSIHEIPDTSGTDAEMECLKIN